MMDRLVWCLVAIPSPRLLIMTFKNTTMCRESYWSQPQFFMATITPLPTFSKYLTVRLWYTYMGGRIAPVSVPLWGMSGNLSSEGGARLHLLKEGPLFLRTVCIVRWDSWMEKCLIQKEEIPALK